MTALEVKFKVLNKDWTDEFRLMWEEMKLRRDPSDGVRVVMDPDGVIKLVMQAHWALNYTPSTSLSGRTVRDSIMMRCRYWAFHLGMNKPNTMSGLSEDFCELARADSIGRMVDA